MPTRITAWMVAIIVSLSACVPSGEELASKTDDGDSVETAASAERDASPPQTADASAAPARDAPNLPMTSALPPPSVIGCADGGKIGDAGACGPSSQCPCESGLCRDGVCVFIACSSQEPCESGVCGLEGVCSSRIGGGTDAPCAEGASLGDCQWRDITESNSGGLIRDLCEDGEEFSQLRRCNGTCFVPDDDYAGFAVVTCGTPPGPSLSDPVVEEAADASPSAAPGPGYSWVQWGGYSCCPR
jgi:hypothetical protein